MARLEVDCTDQTKKRHTNYHVGCIKRYAQHMGFVKEDVTRGKFNQDNRL